MKRPILSLLVLLAVFSFTRPAAAQYGMPNFGNQTTMDEEIQSQRKKQMAQQQQYAKPLPKPAAPRASAPILRRDSADAFGRVDLSGRAAPRYPSIRDNSYSFSSSRYTKGRRTPTRTAPRLFPGVVGNPSRRPR